MKEINKNNIMKEIDKETPADKEENVNANFTISGEGHCSAEFAQGCMLNEDW